ncbi:MMPL family transporter [Gammaproteobacteria bacterium]|nr:MMPL family transporter [Gammaproteobacteria bacterium]
MEKILLTLTELFAKTPNVILNYKKQVLTSLALISSFLFYGIFSLTVFDMSSDSFLEEENPAQVALDEFRRQFGGDESVMLIYSPRDGNVFSRRSLTAVQQLTDDLVNWRDLDRTEYPEILWEELSHVRRIQSLGNVRIQESVGDTLRSDRLIPRQLPNSETELQELRVKALNEQDYIGAFYSEDGAYGAILVQTDFGTIPVEGYEPVVDIAGIELADGFESFDLSFDDNAVVQEVEFQDTDQLAFFTFDEALTAVYQKYASELDFYPVGTPSMMGQMQGVLNQMAVLGTLMVLIFSLLLWVLFRSASALVWPMVTIALSVAWCWGITVWMGITVSTMIALTVLLIFAVGIADCVHVMSAYFSFRRDGQEHYAALSHAYEKVSLAILLTTLTTSAGVSVLATSNLEPIKVFAIMSALGVILAFFFTIVLLPVLLDLWHPAAVGSEEKPSLADRIGAKWNALRHKRKLFIGLSIALLVFLSLGLMVGAFINFVIGLTYWIINSQERILARVPSIVQRSPYLILAIFGSGFVVCAYGATKILIDTNIAEMFKADHPLTIAVEVVDQNMSGAQNMEIMIDTGTSDGMLDAQLLDAVDRLQTRIEERYPDIIGRTNSLANIVKDTNQKMNEDNPEFYRIPESGQAISQLLFMFNSANPEDRRNIVSDDYSRSHISVTARNLGSYEYKELFEAISIDVEETFSRVESNFPNLDVNLTGSMATLMVMADEVANSQFNSFALALLIVSLIMIVSLGSFRGGIMGMVPNAIPAFLAFGLMGLFGIPLDTDTLLIAPIILGIAVDDTIHFMTHYRVELSKTGSIAAALESAIKEVGQAVMFTTMVIGLGFAVLSFSDYLGMAKVGFFGSLAIFVALLCDLFLIPAMIIVFKPKFGVKNVNTDIDFQGVTP